MTTQTPASPDPAALQAARAEGEAAGRTAERARVRAILTHAEAEGRMSLAVQLATGTDMAADVAAATLAAAPRQATAAPTPTNSLYAAVAASGGMPNVPHQGEASPSRKSTLAERQRETMKASGRIK